MQEGREALHFDVTSITPFTADLAKYSEDVIVAIDMTFEKKVGMKLDMTRIRLIPSSNDCTFKAMAPPIAKNALLHILDYTAFGADGAIIKLKAANAETRTVSSASRGSIYWFHAMADANSEITPELFHSGIKL